MKDNVNSAGSGTCETACSIPIYVTRDELAALTELMVFGTKNEYPKFERRICGLRKRIAALDKETE